MQRPGKIVLPSPSEIGFSAGATKSTRTLPETARPTPCCIPHKRGKHCFGADLPKLSGLWRTYGDRGAVHGRAGVYAPTAGLPGGRVNSAASYSFSSLLRSVCLALLHRVAELGRVPAGLSFFPRWCPRMSSFRRNAAIPLTLPKLLRGQLQIEDP
jgi:hypothetical protein